MLFLGNVHFKVILDSVQSKLSKSTLGSTTYWPRFTKKSVPYVSRKEKNYSQSKIHTPLQPIYTALYLMACTSFTILFSQYETWNSLHC